MKKVALGFFAVLMIWCGSLWAMTPGNGEWIDVDKDSEADLGRGFNPMDGTVFRSPFANLQKEINNGASGNPKKRYYTSANDFDAGIEASIEGKYKSLSMEVSGKADFVHKIDRSSSYVYCSANWNREAAKEYVNMDAPITWTASAQAILKMDKPAAEWISLYGPKYVHGVRKGAVFNGVHILRYADEKSYNAGMARLGFSSGGGEISGSVDGSMTTEEKSTKTENYYYYLGPRNVAFALPIGDGYSDFSTAFSNFTTTYSNSDIGSFPVFAVQAADWTDFPELSKVTNAFDWVAAEKYCFDKHWLEVLIAEYKTAYDSPGNFYWNPHFQFKEFAQDYKNLTTWLSVMQKGIQNGLLTRWDGMSEGFSKKKYDTHWAMNRPIPYKVPNLEPQHLVVKYMINDDPNRIQTLGHLRQTGGNKADWTRGTTAHNSIQSQVSIKSKNGLELKITGNVWQDPINAWGKTWPGCYFTQTVVQGLSYHPPEGYLIARISPDGNPEIQEPAFTDTTEAVIHYDEGGSIVETARVVKWYDNDTPSIDRFTYVPLTIYLMHEEDVNAGRNWPYYPTNN